MTRPAIQIVPTDEAARRVAERLVGALGPDGPPLLVRDGAAPPGLVEPSLHLAADGCEQAMFDGLVELLSDPEAVAALEPARAYRVESGPPEPPHGIPAGWTERLLAERFLRLGPLGEPVAPRAELEGQLRASLAGFGEEVIRSLAEHPEAVIHTLPPVFGAANPGENPHWQADYGLAVSVQCDRIDPMVRQALEEWSGAIDRMIHTLLPAPWSSLGWTRFALQRLSDSQAYLNRRHSFVEDIRHPCLTGIRARCLLPFYREAVLISWFDFLLASVEGLLMEHPPSVAPTTSIEDYALAARQLGGRLRNQRRRSSPHGAVEVFAGLIDALGNLGRRAAVRFPAAAEFAALAGEADKAWEALVAHDRQAREALAAREKQLLGEKAALESDAAGDRQRRSGLLFWRRESAESVDRDDRRQRMEDELLSLRQDLAQWAAECHAAAEILRAAGPALHVWARVAATWEELEARRAAAVARIDGAAKVLRTLAEELALECRSLEAQAPDPPALAAHARLVQQRWTATALHAVLPALADSVPVPAADGARAVADLADEPGDAARRWDAFSRALAARLAAAPPGTRCRLVLMEE